MDPGANRVLAYYEAVSPIIPVVILTLAIELRYFSPKRGKG